VPGKGRRYIDARFRDHHREHEAEHRALDAARLAVDARLESMNEFRSAMGDQVGHFPTREVVDARMDALQHRIEEVEIRASRGAIAAGIGSGLAGFVAGAIVVALLS
jgi:hypothetical protein